MKKIAIFAAMLAVLLFSANSLAIGYTFSVTQPDTYDKIVTRDISSMSWENCDELTDEQLFNIGHCSRVWFCAAVIPNTATQISDADWRECVEVSNEYENPSIHITFTPERGMKYAVTTFIFKEYHEAVYNQDGTFSGTYTESHTMPEEYKNIEEVLGLCDDGYMLKGHTCLPAQGICIDQFSTNMCTNEYTMWCLAYEEDSNGNPIFDCQTYPEHACVDRDFNGVCDEVTDVTCSDMNENGICDEDEPLLWNSCIDENNNGICDGVETSGCFCTNEYDPVCAGGTTYPNSCFADCAGYTSYSSGECAPIELVRQCEAEGDCPSIPGCLHIDVTCVDYQCVYSGECEQCQEDADCPDAPCVGVAKQCSELGRCQYSGKCITTPQKADLWSEISAFFSNLFASILSALGW